METFEIVPKTDTDNCCSSIQEFLLAEMEPPEDPNQEHLDKDLVWLERVSGKQEPISNLKTYQKETLINGIGLLDENLKL